MARVTTKGEGGGGAEGKVNLWCWQHVK